MCLFSDLATPLPGIYPVDKLAKIGQDVCIKLLMEEAPFVIETTKICTNRD